MAPLFMSPKLSDRNRESMYLENENFSILKNQLKNFTLMVSKLMNHRALTKIMSLEI